MAAKSPYVIRKYDGDDAYSWAVFHLGDVVGTRGIVFYGEARPVVSGCLKREAEYHAKTLAMKK